MLKKPVNYQYGSVPNRYGPDHRVRRQRGSKKHTVEYKSTYGESWYFLEPEFCDSISWESNPKPKNRKVTVSPDIISHVLVGIMVLILIKIFTYIY